MTTPLRTFGNSGEFARYDAPHGLASEGKVNNDMQNTWMQGDGIEVNSDGVRSLGPVTYNAGHDESCLTGDVLSSVKNPWGTPVSDMAKITDDCIVMINGQEATVKTAVQANLLAKDAQGNYFDPTSPNGARAQVASQHRPQEQHQEPTRVDFLSQDNRKSLDFIKENMGSYATDSAVASLLGRTATGNDPQQAVNVMASNLQVDPSIIQALVSQIGVDIEQNAAKFASKHLGVDGKKLFEYVHQSYSPQMKGHVMLRLYHHDMSVFDDMIHDMKSRKQYPK